MGSRTRLSDRLLPEVRSVCFRWGLVSLLAVLLLLFSMTINAKDPQGKRPAKPKGTFKSAYPPVKDPRYAQFRQEVMKDKILEDITADLNDHLILPVDVTIAFTECGVVNAFYDPETHAIHLCYELIERFGTLFQRYATSDEELEKAIDDAATFVFYHELGHALADIFDLPITGKEEDAVDQLSTFILAEGDDEVENAALNGAAWFILEAQQRGRNVNPLAFADEHSLNEQRFYNILCWLYGQDQQRYAFVIATGILPEERAQRCPNEYSKVAKSWRTLLAPHVKK